MIHSSRLKKELKKLLRFLAVGVSTFIIQVVSYFFFSRIFFPQIDRTASYLLAVFYSLIFNYSANRAWTFGKQQIAGGSTKRYAQVAIAASLLSAFLFWIGHAAFHLYDLFVLVAVNLLIPFFTFISHRVYTFHHEPDKIIKQIVRRPADSV